MCLGHAGGPAVGLKHHHGDENETPLAKRRHLLKDVPSRSAHQLRQSTVPTHGISSPEKAPPAAFQDTEYCEPEVWAVEADDVAEEGSGDSEIGIVAVLEEPASVPLECSGPHHRFILAHGAALQLYRSPAVLLSSVERERELDHFLVRHADVNIVASHLGEEATEAGRGETEAFGSVEEQVEGTALRGSDGKAAPRDNAVPPCSSAGKASTPGPAAEVHEEDISDPVDCPAEDDRDIAALCLLDYETLFQHEPSDFEDCCSTTDGRPQSWEKALVQRALKLAGAAGLEDITLQLSCRHGEVEEQHLEGHAVDLGRFSGRSPDSEDMAVASMLLHEYGEALDENQMTFDIERSPQESTSSCT